MLVLVIKTPATNDFTVLDRCMNTCRKFCCHRFFYSIRNISLQPDVPWLQFWVVEYQKPVASWFQSQVLRVMNNNLDILTKHVFWQYESDAICCSVCPYDLSAHHCYAFLFHVAMSYKAVYLTRHSMEALNGCCYSCSDVFLALLFVPPAVVRLFPDQQSLPKALLWFVRKNGFRCPFSPDMGRRCPKGGWGVAEAKFFVPICYKIVIGAQAKQPNLL